MNPSFEATLEKRLRGGQPLFYIQTKDLAAAYRSIRVVCARIGLTEYRWGPSSGLECLYAPKKSLFDSTTGMYAESEAFEKQFNGFDDNIHCGAGKFAQRLSSDSFQPIGNDSNGQLTKDCVILVTCMDSFLKSPEILQNFTEVIAFEHFAHTGIHMVFIDNKVSLPEQLLDYAVPLDFDLPDEEEITRIIQEVRSGLQETLQETRLKNKKQRVEKFQQSWLNNPEYHDAIVSNLRGMCSLDIKAALYFAASQFLNETTLEKVLPVLSEQKVVAIKRSGVLRFVPYEQAPKLEDIGGFDVFKKYMRVCAKSFTEEARRQGIEPMKGIALVGLPGTGKSYVCSAMSSILQIPLINFDVSSVFGKFVGESEDKLRRTLDILEKASPCVVRVEEAEKAFAGGSSGNSGDSGTSQRVFGMFLEWLQEHKSRTFVVVTVNHAEFLPPEFFRAGRFDSIWRTDRPTSKERKDIFNIHFKKRNCKVNFEEEEWDELISATDKFVGAEIEAVVREAMLQAFDSRGTSVPTIEEIVSCARNRIPMASQDDDPRIQAIIEYCNKHARPVSSGGQSEEPMILQSTQRILFNEE